MRILKYVLLVEVVVASNPNECEAKINSREVKMACITSVKKERFLWNRATNPVVSVVGERATVSCLNKDKRAVHSYTVRPTSDLMKEILDIADSDWIDKKIARKGRTETGRQFFIGYAERVCALLEKRAKKLKNISIVEHNIV